MIKICIINVNDNGIPIAFWFSSNIGPHDDRQGHLHSEQNHPKTEVEKEKKKNKTKEGKFFLVYFNYVIIISQIILYKWL